MQVVIGTAPSIVASALLRDDSCYGSTFYVLFQEALKIRNRYTFGVIFLGHMAKTLR